LPPPLLDFSQAKGASGAFLPTRHEPLCLTPGRVGRNGIYCWRQVVPVKRAALWPCAIALSVAPVFAQTTSSDHIGGAVYQTVKQSIINAGVSEADPLFGATVSAISGAITNLATLGGQGATVLTWAAVLRAVLPNGATVGGGGGFDGGGASGSWTLDYCDWAWRVDADGNLVIPAVPLKTGSAMTKKGTSTSVTFNSGYYYATNSDLGGGTAYAMADSGEAITLWAMHKRGLLNGSARAYWFGYYKTATVNNIKQYYFSRPASYLANGTKVSAAFYNYAEKIAMQYTPYYAANKDCPDGGSAGGNFDFYHGGGSNTSSWNSCTFYAQDMTLGPQGYATSDVAAWPRADIGTFPNGADEKFKNCKIDPSVIARIINEAWDDADDADPSIIPARPVAPSDVVTDGTDPAVKDIAESATDPLPTDGTPTAPTPTTTPSPTPSSTTSPVLDLGQPGTESLKNDASLDPPDFGWWPEAPAINIAGSTTCPTYAFDAFGQHYEITVHCQFAEQNRALISAIMILVFTIAAARIVLEA